MRLLLNDYGGYPFPAQLSRELATRGHSVLHTHCVSHISGKGPLAVAKSDSQKLAFRGLDLGAPFAKHSIIRRFGQERRYGGMLAHAAEDFAPDVIISANTPLFAQALISDWATRRNVPFIFWLQDLVSIAMNGELGRRFGRSSTPLQAFLTRLEARLLRESAAVVSISKDFLPWLASWNIAAESVTVIENWAPLDEIPSPGQVNEWAALHGLTETFNFLYAGTLGLKHDPELLVRLALALRDRPAVRVVVVSEGVGAEHCRRRAAEEQLTNLLVLPFQPYEVVAEMLASSDVLVAILERDAGGFSVPSKVLGYVSAGRPILASVPAENLAARVISDSGSGIVVSPGDPQTFLAAAERLLHDDQLRLEYGARAREYAETKFDISTIANRFESVLAAIPSAGGADQIPG